MNAYQWRWALPVAGGIMLADLITKQIVQVIFAHGERFAVTGFFNLVFVLNAGAAFSLLADAGGWQRPALIGLGAVFSALITFWLVRSQMSRLSAFGCAAVMGGALGNVIDRVRHGAVVDWLDFHLGGWHWPAFNFADIGISAGAAALILDAVLFAPRKRASQGKR